MFAKGDLLTRAASVYVPMHHFVMQIQMEIVLNVLVMTFLDTTSYFFYSACPGGIFQNGQCVQKFPSSPCPSNATPNSEGICVKPATCSTESTLLDGQCVTYTSPSCPSNATPNSEGICVIQATCPSGTTRVATTCTGKPMPGGGQKSSE